MKKPLLYKVYITLRRGWKSMTPESQQTLRVFVFSQKTEHGYMNSGQHEDAYYTQFGRLLEAVFQPVRSLQLPTLTLTVKESLGRETIYGRFFKFLEQEMTLSGRNMKLDLQLDPLFNSHSSLFESPTTNDVCCILAMQHQSGIQHQVPLVKWLQQRQDESGGFYASEQAPIPDLLSTAVASFTLRLIGADTRPFSQFIQAHWIESGGFTPTLFDHYTDVEYVFYGLLALGTV